MKMLKYRLNNKAILISFLILVFSISLSGCSYFQKRYEKTETKEFRLSSAGKTKIIVENSDGNIVIKKNSSDSNIVVNVEIISYVTKKELNEPLKSYEINVDSISSEIRFSGKTTIRDRQIINFGNWGRNSINYTVYLPAGLEAEVSSVNGKLEVSNVTNNITGSTVNGKINVEKSSGILKLETTNGKISAELDSTKGMKLDAVNGSVNLKLSPSFSGIFEADIVNGSIKYDNFDFKDVNKDKKNFKAKLGNSNSEIKISTVNGSIKILKSN